MTFRRVFNGRQHASHEGEFIRGEGGRHNILLLMRFVKEKCEKPPFSIGKLKDMRETDGYN
jgi:hypothetical protein